MDHPKKKENILRQLMAASAHIIENKCNKSNTNLLKAKEWHNIQNKFNELTGEHRKESEIKLAWKRMKLTAKANLSAHRRQQNQTGGGEKPPSPSQEDQEIVAIAPHDFVIEFNDYDSDAVQLSTIPLTQDVAMPGPSSKIPSPTPIIIVDIPESQSEHIVEPVVTDTANEPERKKTQKGIEKRKETKDLLIESNINYKKRNLEMLEIEHSYNIEIAKLKIRKLNMEIEILESQRKESNLSEK